MGRTQGTWVARGRAPATPHLLICVCACPPRYLPAHLPPLPQRSIKDVLERVSVLFKDHADLLRDFTYFLPDAVQEAVSGSDHRQRGQYRPRAASPRTPYYHSPSSLYRAARVTPPIILPLTAQAKERIQRIAEDARRAAAKQQAAAAAAAAAEKDGADRGRPGAGRGGFPAGAGPAGYSSRGATLGKDRERNRDAEREAAAAEDERREEDRLRAGPERERERERERMVDRQRDRLTVGMGPGKSPKMQAVARRRRARDEDMHLTLTPSERSLFGRIKSALGAREAWAEFLKCLDLYASVSSDSAPANPSRGAAAGRRRVWTGQGSVLPLRRCSRAHRSALCHHPPYPPRHARPQEVLSRAELLTLLSDVLGTSTSPSNAKLLEELRSLLANRGTLEMTPEDIWYSMPVGEVDFSQCPRCTPSYRALPSGYPLLACTERSRMEREVRDQRWRVGRGGVIAFHCCRRARLRAHLCSLPTAHALSLLSPPACST
jgi:histone deacetylase complex regulatory component SIN3